MDPSLKTNDIDRCVAGSKLLGAFHTFQRRQERPLVNHDDIVGAHPGSLVKGYKLPAGMVKRATNPLQPDYQIPGNREAPPDKFDPFGEAGCSMTAAAFAAKPG